MLKAKKYIKRANFRWGFIVCLGVSLAALPISSLLAAFAVNMTEDPTANIGICSLLAMIISAAISGIFTAIYKKDSTVGYASLVALCVAIIMLIIGIVVNKGRLSASAFMNYGCYIGVAGICAYLSKHKNGRRRRRR